ncbi:serine protease inhibitor [Paenibacillus baekrokdamisoli]|uniref:Serine protease inhibitor n=1 Tax=Paenibacillus baekrokdamisoli TaxID=1712516 RepID=A0A3G9JI51_9BACL|nr:serpin family protein [Paenibacillus baekrokdamisoli]MBB3068926.1 serpin B [Paenibacillus baekrokdamisoli]BBH23748.1 serine protease inhibitor [Paenibacillus baekrokdamisoli]
MAFQIRNKSIVAVAAAIVLLSTTLAGCGKDKVEAPRYQVKDINAAQVHAYNDFSLRMTKQLLAKTKDGNVCISPLSMAFALSLLVNGAEGETKAELLRVLGAKGLTLEALNQGSDVLRDLLEHADPKVDVRIANAVWARKGTGLAEDYSQRIKRFYEAEASELDFDDADAAKTINQWVNKKTQGLIDRMVDENTLKSSVMVLMNAIYFHGEWTKPFKESDTKDAQFHLADGSSVTVPMMAQKASLTYKESEHFKAVRLPYGDGKWSMTVVLPNEGITLPEAETELLKDASSWREGFTQGMAEIELPRFKLQYGTSLIDALKTLGMKQSFDKEKADFSGMTKSRQSLYVNGAIHKTFIEVNEQGTEAAAVTSITTAATAAAPMDPFKLRVDRPFFFTIEDQTTGAILFLGSVTQPTA